jgi:hypothetical protein
MAHLGNAKSVEESTEKAKRRRRAELEDMRAVLTLPGGRKLLWRYMGIAGIYKTSFTGNYTTFFNEGMRQVGLEILKDVTEASPEAYLLMMQEADKREREDEDGDRSHGNRTGHHPGGNHGDGKRGGDSPDEG